MFEQLALNIEDKKRKSIGMAVKKKELGHLCVISQMMT